MDSGKVTGNVEPYGGAYLFEERTPLHHKLSSTNYVFQSVVTMSVSNENKVMLWHFCLSHPDFVS